MLWHHLQYNQPGGPVIWYDSMPHLADVQTVTSHCWDVT